MFFDPVWLLFALPTMLLMLYAQHKVKSTYTRYVGESNMQGLTGAEVAQRLLQRNGLADVQVEVTEGFLSDHYDPTTKTLRLSPEVYQSASVASLGIVAHEVGHAVQHAKAYPPMEFRSQLVPVVNFTAGVAPWMFLAGIFLQIAGLLWIAVAFFSAAVLFHLVTLPVELDASNRARGMLQTYGLVTTTEFGATDEVLKAAAFTYIAALVQAVGQLLYFVYAAVGMSNRDD